MLPPVRNLTFERRLFAHGSGGNVPEKLKKSDHKPISPAFFVTKFPNGLEQLSLVLNLEKVGADAFGDVMKSFNKLNTLNDFSLVLSGSEQRENWY